jgi:hypothetical protein
MSVHYSLLDIQFQNIQKYTAVLKNSQKGEDLNCNASVNFPSNFVELNEIPGAESLRSHQLCHY